jgi:rod shape-determining protein MreB
MLRGLDRVMAQATGLKTTLVDDALSCVARGTAIYLENLAMWKDTLESDVDDL